MKVSRGALAKLKQAGIVRRRGHLTVLDRCGLKDYACECDEVMSNEFDRLSGLGWEPLPVPDKVRTWARSNMNVGVRI